MLLRLIDDIRNALDNDCLFSALSLALTLPDICGKAEYPKAAVGKRYIDWYDKHVGITERPMVNGLIPEGLEDMPYLSGEVVFNLRCCYLHQGTPNIEKRKIKEECCKIDHFILLSEKKNHFDSYGDTATVSYGVPFSRDGNKYRSYTVSIRRLCLILTACAKGYYQENKEKFNFFKYSIVEEQTTQNEYID
ncbi:MAG: hypothetical protein IJK24_01460 [Oscillospiraceae bacterium]|nr:hypothetical protein [Oscillospiraceae bacterium]MBQ6159592.1 hypothetical protein [Oscillospiraceae bacterium]